mgnify:CR=1 FL=1
MAGEIVDPALAVNPLRQVSLLRSGTDALTVSEGTSILDLGRLGLAMGGLASVVVPLALAWAALSIWLGRAQTRLGDEPGAGA